MISIDTVWARIKAHKGETFHQIRGKAFTYTMVGASLVPEGINQNIPRSDLEKALSLLPLESTVPVQHLRGPSYITRCSWIRESDRGMNGAPNSVNPPNQRKHPMARKRHLSLSAKPVMTLTRGAMGGDRLVYLLTANKTVKYRHGRSRVVYIGTTKRGVRRVSASVAGRAAAVFEHRGLHTVTAHLLTYTRRSGGTTKLWLKLERALLFVFKHEYGTIPLLNKMGRHGWPGREFSHFRQKTLLKRIQTFERV